MSEIHEVLWSFDGYMAFQRSSWTPEQSRDDMFYSLALAERNVEPKQPSSKVAPWDGRACAPFTEGASRVTIDSVLSLRASHESLDNAMRSRSFTGGVVGCGGPSPLIMS